MKITRYAIKKEELHTLLKSIGVLQEQERLLTVSNLDLSDPAQDIVVITVASHQISVPNTDPSTWTFEQLRQRLAELVILEDAATAQLRLILEELRRIQETGDKDLDDVDTGVDDIPIGVEKNIRDQIRRLLNG